MKVRANANEKDETVFDFVRTAIGGDIDLMVDANEKGTRETAQRLLACAQDYGVKFVEEPLPASDPLGFRMLGKLETRTLIATGEHLQGIDRFELMIEDGYSAFVQPDLAMAGGLTPCLKIAKKAAARNMVFAPHFLPGLFVHMHGAFGGEILLEDFPLIESVFEGWPQMAPDGALCIGNDTGHGLRLKQ
ncbi:MAG: hypothetical protein JKY32_13860 [Rhizobiales bacterium]|nr:hypothetical protein [Hyphomicrobiales bacterium]